MSRKSFGVTTAALACILAACTASPGGPEDAGRDTDSGTNGGTDADAGEDADAGGNRDAGEDADAGGNSDAGEDADAGGNRDAGEDADADGDGIVDSIDECPGFDDAACVHGDCSAGSCACEDGWAGTNCDECASGYAGASCAACTCVNGTCDEGLDGDGTCQAASCDDGWAGSDCDECASGYAGASCAACTCVNGTCDEGLDGDGTCQSASCEDGWAGTNCDECVRFVDPGASGTPDGLAWATAFQDIQSAVDSAAAAVDGDEALARCQVWVVAGTYYLRTSAESDALRLKTGVEVYGGFEGTELRRSERDWEARPTILNGHESVAEALDVVHVVVVAGDATTLDGFTITGGNADGGGLGSTGGGLYCDGRSDLEVANCTFVDNTAFRGGAAFVRNSSASIIASQFIGSSATDAGGAIYADTATVALTDSRFEHNDAGGAGGAIYHQSSAVPCTRSVFYRNRSGAQGGALHSNNSYALEMRDCEFWYNDAVHGGGIDIRGWIEPAAIINGLFVGNSAVGSGGGAFVVASGFEITNATVVGNLGGGTPYQGSGLYLGDGGTVTNALVWGNYPAAQLWDANASPTTVTYSSIGSVQPDIVTGSPGNLTPGDDPMLANIPVAWDRTTADGTTTTIEVADGGLYAVDDVIEIEDDAVARTVTGVSGTTVTFDVALAETSASGALVEIWGAGATDLSLDASLAAGSICIDAADGDAAPASDIWGAIRYDDPGVSNTGTGATPFVDIGAFERAPDL